jgi:hypothetical protein
MSKSLFKLLGGQETMDKTGAKFYTFQRSMVALIDSNPICNYVNINQTAKGYSMDFCKIDYMSSGQTKKVTIKYVDNVQGNQILETFLENIK